MIDRRTLLKTMAGAGLVLPFGRAGWAAQTSADPGAPRLVVVMLRGAVDGLNVVVPYAEDEYYRYRSGIAIPRPGVDNGVLDLDGHFGLHPALAPLLPLWQSKRLAFVHACGSPDPCRSHFDAQDYIESGTPGVKLTQDGWMNRLLAALPAPHPLTQAVSLGPVLPRILSGALPAQNVQLGRAAAKPLVVDREIPAAAYDRLYTGDDALSRAYRDGRAAHTRILADLSMPDAENSPADGGAPPPNGFPLDAQQLAQLMRREPRLQLAFLALGGWDTHAGQGGSRGQLANHLQPLGEGLALLAERLGPELDRTVIVVISEFGRTVRQNGSGGTDHGHGNAMWVLGGKVGGGKVYGDWPSLAESALYEQRDLAVTTDFRNVLLRVAERHLRLGDAQLEAVFPKAPGQGGDKLDGLIRA